jgi:hypothetical protein
MLLTRGNALRHTVNIQRINHASAKASRVMWLGFLLGLCNVCIMRWCYTLPKAKHRPLTNTDQPNRKLHGEILPHNTAIQRSHAIQQRTLISWQWSELRDVPSFHPFHQSIHELKLLRLWIRFTILGDILGSNRRHKPGWFLSIIIFPENYKTRMPYTHTTGQKIRTHTSWIL